MERDTGRPAGKVALVTGAAKGRGTAHGRIGTVEGAAGLALFLASDESSYSTGSEFVVDGGWTAGA